MCDKKATPPGLVTRNPSVSESLYMIGISSQEKGYEIWSVEFDGMYEAGCHFVLCTHPQLMGRLSRLNMLERLIKHIKGEPNVWIAKSIE